MREACRLAGGLRDAGAGVTRDVLQEIDRDRTLAYTTIMTVLDNLHRKG
ncbi:MAG: BlaI/MecI/CopY family transcriptional regulator [Actinomycetota bacterium]|nr:BlaI/MecI/CopY family transcriptional regulator [Actinomycetota bacterium]